MRKFSLVALGLIFSPLTFSQEVSSSDLSHYLTLEYGQGTSDYKQSLVYAKVGIDKEISIFGQFVRTTQQSESGRELAAGLSYNASESWNITGSGLIRRQPGGLDGRGFSLSPTFKLSNAWDGENRTLLSYKLTFINYQSQEVEQRLRGSLSFNTDFAQIAHSFSVEQEITKYFNFGTEFVEYRYQDSSITQGNDIQQTLRFSQAFDGVSDYPDKSLAGFVTISPFSFLDIDLLLEETKSRISEYDSQAQEAAITIYPSDSWDMKFSYSKLKSSFNSETYSAGITFNF